MHWRAHQQSHAACADAENDGGLTPLHSAALGNSLSCAQLLLDAGADRNAIDRDGRTPCDHAPEAAEKLHQLLKPSAAARKLPGATQATLNGVPAEEQSPSQAFAVSFYPTPLRQSLYSSPMPSLDSADQFSQASCCWMRLTVNGPVS